MASSRAFVIKAVSILRDELGGGVALRVVRRIEEETRSLQSVSVRATLTMLVKELEKD